jgi:hypothetical protein
LIFAYGRPVAAVRFGVALVDVDASVFSVSVAWKYSIACTIGFTVAFESGASGHIDVATVGICVAIVRAIVALVNVDTSTIDHFEAGVASAWVCADLVTTSRVSGADTWNLVAFVDISTFVAFIHDKPGVAGTLVTAGQVGACLKCAAWAWFAFVDVFTEGVAIDCFGDIAG